MSVSLGEGVYPENVFASYRFIHPPGQGLSFLNANDVFFCVLFLQTGAQPITKQKTKTQSKQASVSTHTHTTNNTHTEAIG